MKRTMIAAFAVFALSIGSYSFAAENCAQYLNSHPAVSQARTNPNLIYNQKYLNEHPDFKHYLNKHPGICENYARGATQYKKNKYGKEYANQPNPASAEYRARMMHEHPGQVPPPPPGTYNNH